MLTLKTTLPAVALLAATLAAPLPTNAAPLQPIRSELMGWVDYYSRVYSAPHDPNSIYDADTLWYHVARISQCETANWTAFVGDYGNSIGPMQFHARGIYPASPQARAGYSRWDFEANVAAGAYFISRGYGPQHWYTCWRIGHNVQP